MGQRRWRWHLARLVEQRLAACVNLLPPVRSIYHWKGAVEEGEETLMIIKSARPLFEQLKTAIAALHSYETPEIIARMRYLGRLKERLYGFHAGTDDPPDAGARIYSPAFGETPCGTIINAAPAPNGGHALLAVVQISAIEADALSLDGEDGPRLTRFALPYPIPPNETPRGRIA